LTDIDCTSLRDVDQRGTSKKIADTTELIAQSILT